jgi:acyl-ACP thioesterase
MPIDEIDQVDAKFRLSFEVRQRDVDRYDRLTPAALYGSMQDAAIAQSAARGVSRAAFMELGYAWMLNRIHLEVDRYPRILERIVIETWGSNLTGLYAIREFRVLDEADCEIARATSRWIVIDVARKRAIRLPGLLVERYGVVPERALADSFPKLELSDGREHQSAFRVRWSELDGNRHANSACYVDWLVESVPKEVLEGHVLRELELEYKRELVLGDALVSESALVALGRLPIDLHG